MLTRLRVKGFKNLLDCTVSFGPFTCIAGANAAGKSNLFDAIMFLRDLAELPIIEAASRVRDRSGSRRGDIKSLFTALPDGFVRDMEFETEFLVPKTVRDDFDREAKPSATHLRYRLQLRYSDQDDHVSERIELLHESLVYIQKGESQQRVGFPAAPSFWSSVMGGVRRADFISTEKIRDQLIIKLRQDGGKGRALEVPAANSPRTVLCSVNTDDKPTALAARREMQSWTFLQLEPTRMRRPDEFSDPQAISSDGGHMPGTLERLGSYVQVANKLSELLPDVMGVQVDVDAGRRLRTLQVVNRDGIGHPARSLSDGTLRFLALAILSEDRLSGGLICLEEPENGIHPSRIPAMLDLLEQIAVDPDDEVGPDNPLRQVIINTHSPVVVRNLNKQDLVICYPYKHHGATVTAFAAIDQTWRTLLPDDLKMESAPLGKLLSYLVDEDDPTQDEEAMASRGEETVRHYAFKQGLLDFGDEK
jgi:predicted ATPase